MLKVQISFLVVVGLSSVSFAYLPADFDNSGIVDLHDFSVFANQWLRRTEEPNYTYPKYEIIGSSGLTFTRDSVIVDGSFTNLSSNEPRIENVCVASRPEVIVAWNSPKIRAIAVDGNDILGYYSNKFYRFTPTDFNDGNGLDNLQPYFTINGHDDIDYLRGPNDYIISVKVAPNGLWLLAMASLREGTTFGHLFGSDDKGVNWTPSTFHSTGNVLEISQGAPARISWGFCGEEVVFITYGASQQEDSPRKVYYSDDSGLSWTMIHDPGGILGQHGHVASFGMNTNTIYLSYGDPVQFDPDNDACRIDKLIYYPVNGNGKTDPANWRLSDNSPITRYTHNPTELFADGEYLYIGKDATWCFLLARLDMRTDKIEGLVDVPYFIDSPNTPYRTYQAGACFNIFKHDGVLYAPCRSFGDVHASAIYVSANGKHWTAVARDETHVGFAHIAGYAGGYLWGYTNAAKSGGEIAHPFRMEVVQAQTVEAIKVEQATKNQLSYNPDAPVYDKGAIGFGYFKNGLGADFSSGDIDSWNINWRPYDVYTSPRHDMDFWGVTSSTTEPLYGTHCLRVKARYVHDETQKRFHVITPRCENAPKAGQHICASYWVKKGPNFPALAYITDSYIDSTSTGGYIPTATGKATLITTEWRKISIWSRAVETGELSFSRNPRIIIPIDFTYYAENILELGEEDDGVSLDDVVLYFDCAQITYHDNTWDSGDWQPGDAPPANERAVVPFADVGNSFTCSFFWHPARSSREFTGDLPIATLEGVNKAYLELIYNPGTDKFQLTNGINTESSMEVSWEFHDTIKFAITTDGSNTRLHVETVYQGQDVSAGTEGVGLGEPPLLLRLSEDPLASEDKKKYGVGLYTYIRLWDSELSNDNVETVFDAVGALISH